MRNLIKKSLAFLLVAALALTCFVGTLTVSAENPTATITITADAVEAGATEIPVTLTVESEVGINEALIKVSSDLGTIAAEATLVSSDAAAKIEYAEGTTDFGAFYLSALSPEDTENTELGEVTYAEIEVVFTNAGIAAKETPYTVNVEVPADKVIAASKDEEAIDIVCDGLEIVVEEVASCEHVWDIVVANDATETTDGSIEFACNLCGETDVQTVKYWSRHTFYQQNLILASQIEIKFMIRDDRFNDTTLGAATEGFAKVTVAAETGDIVSYVTGLESQETTINSGRAVRSVFVGLAAKQMTDDVTANTFIKVNDVWYSGLAKTVSIEGKSIAGLQGSSDDNLSKLYANLLTYGSKCQSLFGYRVDKLADANLGTYASYVTTENPVIAEDVAQTAGSSDAAVRTYDYSLVAAAKTEAQLFFRTDKISPLPEITDVKMHLVYGKEGNQKITDLTGAVAEVPAGETRVGRYKFTYSDVYPKNMRDTVTLEFSVGDGAPNNTVTFSIAGLAARGARQNAGNPALVAVYYSMINFADAAAAVFG